MSNKNLDFIRQFLSPFIDGDNAEAILGTLADEDQKLEELSVAVNDQLSISTSSDIYLDKQMASRGLPVRPAELGMEDLAFRDMGIQIDANKQISEVIHTVLSTFYGDEAVRAFSQSGLAEPYVLQDGMDLRFVLEDGIEQTCTFQATDFANITQANAREVADVLTRFLRNNGYAGYALPFLDVETGDTFVRLFGSAKGPYSLVQVTGGEAQTVMRFPVMRGTELLANDTVWEITRTIGSTIRFRWSGSGSAPALDKVFVGDRVLIYGSQFKAANLSGTFVVTNVRPPQASPSYDSGWFEFEKLDFTGLRSSQPNVAPPPNQAATPWSALVTYPSGYVVSFGGKYYESLINLNIGNQPDTSPADWVQTQATGVFYTLTLSQALYRDLMFFLGKKSTPYTQPRFSLAWEPSDSLLKIYLPATTKVVKRDLIGSAHVHALYPVGNLDGAFGSATDAALKVEVVSAYSVRYPQLGFDNTGFGGLLTYGLTSVAIDYVAREDQHVTVVTKTPHGITGTADQYGRVLSSTIVTVQVERYDADDEDNPFLGPYAIDPDAGYALGSSVATTREKILAGDSLTTLFVKGLMPNQQGELWFDLNKDSQEGPVRYLGSQVANAPTLVNILSISQNGTMVTVITEKPHGAIPTSQVQISGTVNFNGVAVVDSVPSATVYTYVKTPPNIVSEVNTGTSATLVEGAASTLIMDPSYNFRFNHEVGADVTLLDDTKAYTPIANGLDYPFYVTGTADGRVFVQDLIQHQLAAAGINLEIVIVYPSDVGLGNQGGSDDPNDPPTSDKVTIWGQ